MNMQTNVPLTIAAAAALVLALVAVGVTYFVQQGTVSGLQDDVMGLETNVTSLESQVGGLEGTVNEFAGISAFGGGVNMKMMPGPDGNLIHAMDEVFTFDSNHAICRVETNPVDFVMPTFGMGAVSIPANAFYMAMNSNRVDTFDITTNADGSRSVVMTGELDCVTEVVLPGETHGARDVGEPATYRITAVDHGPGGGMAGDTFEFTVYFAEDSAPLNRAIFGPEFTFTGTMTAGEITVLDYN